jgi:aryl-alcohol dehydrogenase-like predicted oxidoreductase
MGLHRTDAFVFHNLSHMRVFESLMRPGAGFDQLGECVSRGLTRFRGISSHDPDVLRAAIEAGVCDIAMFPIGPFVDARYVSETLPLARAKGVATVCFKTFGAGKLLGDVSGYGQALEGLQARPRGKLSSGGSDGVAAVLPRLGVEECVHYTLTLDPDVALLGLSFPNEQDAAFAAARSFVPLSEERMADIRRRASEARREKGACWWNPDPEA